ncbi:MULTISPECIES: hypothetical protein [unclassified Arthrobacter]|uniref:hypothetical protein n=1 Tax=unclassified Arthrobacter TaxID=235627 RepID=UPI0009A6E81A|nr:MULTISPECIES: hypothetical protein [unclassified Arthrobacter]PNH82986.1 hypothetical protein CXZ05_13765 [Arthrobacter sp. AFG20]SLK17133.1 hypothetical protein SAMN06272721_1383 [Arthrobacter sp. P2b]
MFYTKVHNGLLQPFLAADKAPAPLRQFLATIDRSVNGYIQDARIKNAAWKLKTNIKDLTPKER